MNFLLVAISTGLLIPAAILFIEVANGLRRKSVSSVADLNALRPYRSAVVMPAHNESSGIAPAIQAVLAQLQAGDRLVVVADNCTDDTASVARLAGAEVIERHDPERKGKGYALDFGVRWLEKAPPDFTIIVDADCGVQPHCISELTRLSAASGRPTQALYLMHAAPNSRLSLRIAEFAWIIKNKVRPLGCLAMGWPCQLMGTGMAFPWSVMQAAPLATGHLVEDMQLGLDLAKTGTPPLFCPRAQVISNFPSDVASINSQRTRWEHGHISVLIALGPKILWRALKRRNFSLLFMVLDLMVPPLAGLVLILAMMGVINTIWWFFTARAEPMMLSLIATTFVLTSVVFAWVREGRQIVSPGEMLSMPWYVIAKIPVYIRLFTKRQVEWVRTKRD